MLIQYEVENYRSIRDRQILSLVSSNYYQEQSESLISPGLPGLSGVDLLPIEVIMGANASGKSALIRSLFVLRGMVLDSFVRPAGHGLEYDPFLLSDETASSPTSFGLVFASAGVRYEYDLSYVATHVVRESLSAYPKGREQKWFVRSWNEEKGEVEFELLNTSYVKLPKKLSNMLRDDALFLSFASRLNIESLKPVVDWFDSGHLVAANRSVDAPIFAPERAFSLLEEPSSIQEKQRFIELLKDADFGIQGVRVIATDGPLPDELKNMLNPSLLEQINGATQKTALVTHSSDGSKGIELDIDDESTGTKQFFELAPSLLAALSNSGLVFIDELDASLHPVLLKELVSLFRDKRSNPHGAQLVFTAHDVTLLDEGYLRRDEIWLTEKGEDGGTSLYPLSACSPRNDESLMGGYLVGRYGGVPVVPEPMSHFGESYMGD